MNSPQWVATLLSLFSGAPLISTLLLLMGLAVAGLWIHSVYTLKLSTAMPEEFFTEMREFLFLKKFDKALIRCRRNGSFAAGILSKGIALQQEGCRAMSTEIRNEGRLRAEEFNKRLEFLKSITVAAPIFGAAGSAYALIMHWRFSDMPAGSIFAIIEGIYVAFPPLLLGAIVCIFSMAVTALIKSRIDFLLNIVTNELATLIKCINFDEKK